MNTHPRFVLGIGIALGIMLLTPAHRAAADGATAPDKLTVFPKNLAIRAEVPQQVVIDSAGTGTQRASWIVRSSDGKVCEMSAIFALVSDRGIVIARGNALTCPASQQMRFVVGYFIDDKSHTGAFKGYCVKRDHAGDAEDWEKNPCLRAVIPAHTTAHFLFKREVVL